MRRVWSFLALTVSAACVTYVEPVMCQRGDHEEITACPSTVKKPPLFCVYDAISMAGDDCARVGIGEGHNVCIIEHGDSCMKPATIGFSGQDCSLTRLHFVSGPGPCSAGGGTFVAH